jgi:hypothetical protein
VCLGEEETLACRANCGRDTLRDAILATPGRDEIFEWVGNFPSWKQGLFLAAVSTSELANVQIARAVDLLLNGPGSRRQRCAPTCPDASAEGGRCHWPTSR